VGVKSAAGNHSEAYGAFALAYDASLGSNFFRIVSRHLDDLNRKYPAITRTHLDLACGTGQAVRWFAHQGFASFGLDASIPMLARARAADSPSRSWIAADMRQLPLRPAFARITCLYDSLNHLLELDELVTVFRSVRELMDAGSLFWFDVNHPSAYSLVWSIEEPYLSTGDDHRLEIATSFDPRDDLATGVVTGWAVLGGERVEISETHYQRSYSEKQLLSALQEGGLERVESFRFSPFEQSASGKVKLFFVVRRKEAD
jgi:SAM-dependent methyltransferase